MLNIFEHQFSLSNDNFCENIYFLRYFLKHVQLFANKNTSFWASYLFSTSLFIAFSKECTVPGKNSPIALLLVFVLDVNLYILFELSLKYVNEMRYLIVLRKQQNFLYFFSLKYIISKKTIDTSNLADKKNSTMNISLYKNKIRDQCFI